MDTNNQSELIRSLRAEGDKLHDRRIVLGTHNGEAHADDVLATVVLMHVLCPLGYKVKVIRSRNVAYLKEHCNIIYDVGFGRYDHHGPDPVYYPNGVMMAACGKILNDVITNAAVLEGLRTRLFYGVEANDNGQADVWFGEQSKLSFVSSFNPLWNEDRSEQAVYRRFMQMVSIVGNIYERTLTAVESDIEAYSYVTNNGKLILDDKFILLDKYCQTYDYLKCNRNVLGSVYPNDGQWAVRFAPTFKVKHQSTLSAPAWMCGKHDKELQELIGIPSARFCHNAGFIVVFDTKGGVLEFLTRLMKGDYAR